MKKFERFIIYPLLFIAVFFSFADDGLQQTTAQQFYNEIIAKNIKIVDERGNKLIELSAEKNEVFEQGYGKINVFSKSSTLGNSNTNIQAGSIDLNNNSEWRTYIGTGSINLKDNKNAMNIGSNFRNFKDDFFEEDEDNDNDLLFGFGIDLYERDDPKDNLVIGENSTMLITNSANNTGGSIILLNGEGDFSIMLGKDNNEHGLITVFDKYGERYRGYSYK